MSLEAGLAAFKQGDYAKAIDLLSAYCQDCEASGATGSLNYMNAQTGLIKSYHVSGQVETAIAHCEALRETDNTALKIWIDRTLPTLSAPPAEKTNEPHGSEMPDASHHSAEQLQLLESGIAALRAEEFSQAIERLHAFLQDYSNVNSRNYMQAQTGLIKAYQSSGDKEKAIELCQALLETDNAALKSWATKALATLLPPEAIAAASLKPTMPPPEGTTSHPIGTIKRQPLPHETSPIPQTRKRTPAPSLIDKLKRFGL